MGPGEWSASRHQKEGFFLNTKLNGSILILRGPIWFLRKQIKKFIFSFGHDLILESELSNTSASSWMHKSKFKVEICMSREKIKGLRCADVQECQPWSAFLYILLRKWLLYLNNLNATTFSYHLPKTWVHLSFVII